MTAIGTDLSACRRACKDVIGCLGNDKLSVVKEVDSECAPRAGGREGPPAWSPGRRRQAQRIRPPFEGRLGLLHAGILLPPPPSPQGL
jgi:hypothetical protein